MLKSHQYKKMCAYADYHCYSNNIRRLRPKRQVLYDVKKNHEGGEETRKKINSSSDVLGIEFKILSRHLNSRQKLTLSAPSSVVRAEWRDAWNTAS